jgi:oligoribonuclease NrnB/cAMP/cGMP phosphodiesterase (DHH superfamily)
LVTHGNCPDGAAAAVLATRLWPKVQITWGNHQVIGDQVLGAGRALREGGILVLADISGDAETLKRLGEILIAKKATLYIYEHHQTREFLSVWALPAGLAGSVVFDNGRCGSRIFFDEWLGREPSLEVYREFVTLTNDRDLWLNKDPRSTDQARLHHIYGDQPYLKRFVMNPSVDLTVEERTILDYQQRKDREKIDKILEKIEVKEDDVGFRYGVVYGEADSTDLLHQAILRHDLEYAIHINLNVGKGSIRGRGSFDCATYAEKRGGGGHRNASGFPVRFQRPKF